MGKNHHDGAAGCLGTWERKKNMRYRWKLLILLLIIGLLPLAVARFYGQSVLHELGEELVARTQENLIKQTNSRLRLLVQSYSAMLWKGRERIEIALAYQAKMAELALQGPVATNDRVYDADEFNSGTDLPQDVRPMVLDAQNQTGGKRRNLRISEDHQFFTTPNNARRKLVKTEIDRLATLTPVYRQLYAQLKEHVLWHFTALEDGLYGAYPGHEGLSPQMDARKQTWYRQAFEGDKPWSDPYVDPATGKIVVAGLRLIHRPAGRPAGVTGIVVPIDALLTQPLLTEHIPPETRPYFCYLAVRKDSGQPGARIIAHEPAKVESHRRREVPMDKDWLTCPDQLQFQDMLKDIEAGLTHIRRMPHEGRDSIWVYGPTHPGAFLVLITPYDEIIRTSRKAADEVTSLVGHMARTTLVGMSGIALLIIVLAIAFSRTVTRPIQALVEGTLRLARGDFSVQVDIRSHDEFGQMGRVFNSVGPQLLERYQMRQSLGLAMEVQQNLMPGDDPRVDGLDIAGRSLYCDETGGDYYDYLETGDSPAKSFRVVVGDVAGHGISSALLMTTARAFIRQRAAMPGNLAEIVFDVNRLLARDVETSAQFMTLFMGEIDHERRNLTWVRAGHDPAILFDRQSRQFQVLSGPGLPLGIFATTAYSPMSRSVRSGQIILIGTDGIWEAENSAGERFGKQRLHRIVEENEKLSAREIVDAVFEGISGFRGSQPAKDDVTLVVIKVV
jgi:sigma-B regulation protein RsbU (phosphoserine phosphatase)